MKKLSLRVLRSEKLPCDSCGGKCCTFAPFTYSELKAARAANGGKYPAGSKVVSGFPVKPVFGGGMASMVVKEDGYTCAFLQGGRCSIYAARPRACRVYGRHPELPLSGLAPPGSGGDDQAADRSHGHPGRDELRHGPRRRAPCAGRDGVSFSIFLIAGNRGLDDWMHAADLFGPFKRLVFADECGGPAVYKVALETDALPSPKILEIVRRSVEQAGGRMLALWVDGQASLAWRDPTCKTVSTGTRWGLLDDLLKRSGFPKEGAA